MPWRLAKQGKPGHRICEQNTKATLIEPVAAALGWNLFDPDEVNREHRLRSSDNPWSTRSCCALQRKRTAG